MSDFYDRTIISQLNDLKQRVSALESQDSIKIDRTTGLPYFTTLTPGSVLFAGTSGLLSQDNANLFWDDTNNRLGIGNAAPGVTLDVTGQIRLSSNLTQTGGIVDLNGAGSRGAIVNVKGAGNSTSTWGIICVDSGLNNTFWARDDGTVFIKTALLMNGTQVVASRQTGWNAPSGSLLRGTFNSGTATLAQTAQTLAALITDLRTHGLIGT